MTDKPLVEKMVEASWWPFRAADGVKRRAEMGAALAVAKPEIEKALLLEMKEYDDAHGYMGKCLNCGTFKNIKPFHALIYFAKEHDIDLGGIDD